MQALILPPQDAMVMLKYGNPDGLEVPNLKVVIIAGGKASIDRFGVAGAFTRFGPL